MQSQPSDPGELIRYLKLVQEPGGFELLILRAHLLAEEKLRQIVRDGLPHPEHLEDRTLGFSQNLMLAKCLHWTEEKDWIWECLKLLNGVRNTMAHNLLAAKEEALREKMDRLDLLVGKHSGVPMPSNLGPSAQRLHWRLASLYAEIAKL